MANIALRNILAILTTLDEFLLITKEGISFIRSKNTKNELFVDRNPKDVLAKQSNICMTKK